MNDQSNILVKHDSRAVALPAPRVNVNVRLATLADLPAIDRLQKMHSKQLGFFPRAQMEGYITNGWVIVAEEVASCELLVASGKDSSAPLLATSNSQPATRRLVGYCASRDRYLKRDELGAIFQLCVDPNVQRKFVGALLLKSVFERSAYGTKLYCCWCAQDLDANRFWEACGFVPLAFRTGARKKGKNGAPRMHIFWQKRIREGDTGDVANGGTPWWFPSQTSGGAMMEDRLVFPIPPGVRWSDAMPVVLPQSDVTRASCPCLPEKKQTTGKMPVGRNAKKQTTEKKPAKRALGGWGAPISQVGGLRCGPAETALAVATVVEKVTCPERGRREKPRAPKQKNDPKLIAAARELRDRWLERVNQDPMLLESCAKYDVARAIAHVQDAPAFGVPSRPMLAA